MRKISFAVLLILLLLLVALPVFSEETEVLTIDDYRYSILEDGTVSIVEYTGSSEDVVIPSDIDGHIVSTIDRGAFNNNETIKNVTIPDSVITVLGNPWQCCKSLQSFKVSSENSSLAVIDGVLFEKSEKKLLCYPKGKSQTSYKIPNGIQIIGEKAFYFCDRLTSVTIPDSVTEIGRYAFHICRGLTKIDLPESIVVIEEGAFASTNLVSVTIPSKVTEISDYTFELSKLSSIVLPEGLISIGTEAFSSCDLWKVTIPENVVNIGDLAFAYCSKLQEINLPDSLRTIGSNPFCSCDMLATIHLSTNHPVLELKEDVLFDKVENRLISFPNWFGVKTIQFNDPSDPDVVWKTFNGDSYTIPDGTKTVGDYAFTSCYGLYGISIPSSVTKIGKKAFKYCEYLKEVEIPIGLVEIDDYAFQDSGLTNITLSSTVLRFGINPFKNCFDLIQIQIASENPHLQVVDGALISNDKGELISYLPGTVHAAFTVPGFVEIIKQDAFNNCHNLTTVTIGNHVTIIEASAFYGCSGLISVTVPESVSEIGRSAFGNCESLDNVVVISGSYGEQYCIDNGLPYSFSDEYDWLK